MIEYLGPNGRGALRREEGRRLKAYQDQGGVWTIGDGHTKTARAGMVITDAQADALFERDVFDHADPIVRAIGNAPTTRSQLDAFVIAAFNVGVPRFIASGVVEAHKRGDVQGVHRAWARLPATVKGVPHPVLIARRARELERYLRVDDEYVIGGPQSRAPSASPLLPADGQHASPTPDVTEPQKPLAQSRTIGGSVIAGAGTIATVAATAEETAPKVKGLLAHLGVPLDVLLPSLLNGLTAITLAGIAYAIYARWDDRRTRKN